MFVQYGSSWYLFALGIIWSTKRE